MAITALTTVPRHRDVLPREVQAVIMSRYIVMHFLCVSVAPRNIPGKGIMPTDVNRKSQRIDIVKRIVTRVRIAAECAARLLDGVCLGVASVGRAVPAEAVVVALG